MKIEILGTGCPKCRKVKENAEKAVQELGVEAEFVKVTDINNIMSYGVMVTPALAIDGKVMAAGKVPTIEEIKNWLK